MTDLNNLLNQVKSPEPSDLLKARILQQAKAQRPSETIPKNHAPKAANDNGWKRWAALAAMAIILGVVGVGTLTPVQTNEVEASAELWAEAAQNMGYEDLYAWVEGDTVEGQAGENASYPL